MNVDVGWKRLRSVVLSSVVSFKVLLTLAQR